MLYSIGYSGLSPQELKRMLDRLGVDVLVDVRAKPMSRKPGFSKKALQTQLGARYAWHGDVLGGPGGGGAVQPRGLALLKRLHDSGKTVMIMCLEHKPEHCHRHTDIAAKLLPAIEVEHVFEDSIVLASELQHALDTDVAAKLYDLPE
jgi:uncharacterized protein (DUF488 family)